MLIQMKCPQCGAEMNFDNTREFMFCSYCGAKVANLAERKSINITQNVNVSGTVVHKRDTSNDPNLVIEFSSINLSYTLLTVVNKEQWVYTNGQSKSYRLNPGKYDIRFTVANRKWNRTIYIPFDNSPVSIRVVFSGHTKIYINQPSQGFADWHNQQMALKEQKLQQKAQKEQIKAEKKATKNGANTPLAKPAYYGVNPTILHCPNCGNQHFQGQVFCGNCGHKLI